MTIPFLDLLKKFTARRGTEEAPAEVARPYPVAPAKPSSERLSKTVMPNATRATSSSTDFFQTAGDSSPNIRAAGTRALPPTVALALQPNVERAISLSLSDVIGSVPVGFLKPTESFDASQTILLKASEIEKGMGDGKPAVSLFSIYEQVPDIFVRNVRPDDANQISVPHAKVLEQLRKMQVRDDQDDEVTVPQVDTPILKVTIEDTQRFGTKLPPITVSAQPRVKVEPATAKAISSAEPEPAGKEKFGATAPIPTEPVDSAPPPNLTPRPSAPDPVAPARIPFKLPPKGADETASERVPASSSSSVPLSGSPALPPSATRIPFKMTPPCNDLKPKLQIVPGIVAADVKNQEAGGNAPSGAKISLGLRAVAQNMPSFQLHRPADTVPTDVRFDLPLSLVESQLATGRVAVPIKAFRDALPEEFRSIVVIDAGEAPVLLPLQEVLTNLSPDSLKMRDDQVAEDVAASFETPFSIKAAEDARRFTAEVASGKPSEAAPVDTKKETAPAPVEPKSPVEPKKETAPAPVEPKSPLEIKKETPEAAVKPKLPRPDPGPVLKLPPIDPPQKPVAPPAAKAEIKMSAPVPAPIKPVSELKTPVAAPIVSAPPAIERKPEPKPVTSPASATKVNLEPKPAALTSTVEPAKAMPPKESAQKGERAATVPAPKPPIEAKPQPKQVAPAQSQPAPAITNETPSANVSPAPLKMSTAPKPGLPPKEGERKDVALATPLKLSVAAKAEPTPKADAQKDIVAATPKIEAKPEPLPAMKMMPTAPAPALSEPSQPLMQNNPVPSQVPAPPAAIKPAVPPVVTIPAPAKAETPTPNKFSEKPVEKAEVNANAKAVVEEAGRLNGISAITILLEDGLALAGQLPEDMQAGGLCAVAPSILKKINRHTVDTKFGSLVAMTLDWKNAQVSFFMAGTVCLGVMHSQPVLPAETHRRLTELTGQLSRTYAQPGN